MYILYLYIKIYIFIYKYILDIYICILECFLKERKQNASLWIMGTRIQNSRGLYTVGKNDIQTVILLTLFHSKIHILAGFKMKQILSQHIKNYLCNKKGFLDPSLL